MCRFWLPEYDFVYKFSIRAIKKATLQIIDIDIKAKKTTGLHILDVCHIFRCYQQALWTTKL